MNINRTNLTGRVGDLKSKVIDGFTTFGVFLYNFDHRKWYEVSLLGRLYDITENKIVNHERIPTDLSNELIEGSIISVAGVNLVFSRQGSKKVMVDILSASVQCNVNRAMLIT